MRGEERGAREEGRGVRGGDEERGAKEGEWAMGNERLGDWVMGD